MKTKVILLISVAGMFTFSSCKKCYDCERGGSTAETCKMSGETQKEFNNRISTLETIGGYDCK